MRNKADLDELSMDDLYKNLKVYEAEIKIQSSLISNSLNVAFVSLENTSSTNEAVNTAHEVTTASSHGQASSATYADDVMFSFFVNQSNSGHAYHEGKEILKEDKKESKFQWQRNYSAMPLVVTDEMCCDWSFQTEEGPTDFALMAYLSSGSSNSSSSNTEFVPRNESAASSIVRIVVEQPKDDRPECFLLLKSGRSDSDDDCEVDINKKTENQAKMTKLSMEWKRLCRIKAKVQKYQSQSQYRRISSQTGAGTEEYY
ncbi:hypothetical protein Tco_0261704 [Tanacetum coccineum]